MKIKCEFTIELKTQEDFSKVINYMKETDVLDDYLNDEGVVTRSTLRSFLKNECEHFIKFRLGL